MHGAFAADARVIEAALPLYAALWARCAPLFLLLPWLILRSGSWLFALALSLAFAATLMPLVLASAAPLPAAALWFALPCELVRGSVVAIGCGLPFVVLAIAAGAVEGLQGVAADGGRMLSRGVGFVALVAAVSAAFLTGCARLLLDPLRLPELGSKFSDLTAVRALLLDLARLLIRSLELGVSFSAPVLLGVFCCAIVLGLLGRLTGSVIARGAAPVLLPYLGLGLLCLSTASWLDAIPDLVRSFAAHTARLLGSLH